MHKKQETQFLSSLPISEKLLIRITYNKANGTTQLEVLSRNSKNGSPERGRLKAVIKAQNIAQIRIALTG